MKIVEIIDTVPSTVFYHLTPARNLPRIIRDGLIPKIGTRSRLLGEPTPAIYLFHSMEDAEDAMMNWYGEQFSENAQIALLAVNVPNDATRIVGAGYERILASPVPSTNITIISRDYGSSL